MTVNEELLNKLIELQSYRQPVPVRYENRHGSGADLFNKDYYNCPRCGRRLRNKQHDKFCGSCGQAIDWEPPKPRHWTYADIQIAKGLDAYHVKAVYKKAGEYGTYALDGNSGGELVLPDFAFASLREDETVLIEDILKEDSKS